MSKYRTEDGFVSSNNLDVIERWNKFIEESK